MTDSVNRRDFLVAAAGLGAVATLPTLGQSRPARPVTQPHDPNASDSVVIASSNGLETVRVAREHIESGGDPLDAIVEGVAIVRRQNR